MATIRKRQKKWQAIVRRKGHPALSKSFLYRRDAERWARQTEQAIERGERPERACQINAGTLSDLIEHYKERVLPAKKSETVERYILSALQRQPFAEVKLDCLCSEPFQVYRDHRLTLVKPSTVVRELNLLKQCFELARQDWGLQHLANPLESVKFPRVMDARIRRLGAEEETALLRAALSGRTLYMVPLIRLAIETGLRRGELLALTWQDVDLQRRELIVQTSKNGSPRSIALSSTAVHVLCALQEIYPGPLVFETTSNAVRLTWQRLMKRTAIQNLRFHDLRHEAISRFFEKGLTLPEVAAMSGHKDPRMLMRYAHGILPSIKEKI